MSNLYISLEQVTICEFDLIKENMLYYDRDSCTFTCINPLGSGWWPDLDNLGEEEKCKKEDCNCSNKKKECKNNDDNDCCAWCGGELKIVDTGMFKPMKICKNCGK